MSPARPWFLYVVRCADGTLYTGISTDVQRRVKQHNAGRGARYTASRRPVKLQAVWRFPSHQSALKAEIVFKRRGRPQKDRLVQAAGDYREGKWESTGSG
jgi:putative endonuclease